MTSTFYKYILTTMDFPLLHLESLPAPPATVLGFSMFNTSHRFYGEFVRSLNMSWRESCDLRPYPGPAVRGDPENTRGEPQKPEGNPKNPSRKRPKNLAGNAPKNPSGNTQKTPAGNAPKNSQGGPKNL
ncbi:glutamate receptor ionotropic, kainate 5-like, partial [Neopelma chrysocephalum]|uniref:glutamate receptor ionotropic, kainate 5-like n=1 Tax=Neopelma chrysocephalum TaxID=114329 RepID=UPI000FCCF462